MTKKLPTIIFNTKSIEWFCAFCAAVKEINNLGGTAFINFKGASFKNNYPFKSDSEILPESIEGEVIVLEEPEEDVYEHLDELFAKQWQEYTYKNHGVNISEEQAKGPHSIARIARALVTSKLGIYYEPHYLTPSIKEPTNYDILCPQSLEKYLDIVKKEKPDFTYLVYPDDYTPLTEICSEPKIVITSPKRSDNILLKGKYRGPDSMDRNPLILSIVEEKSEDPGRFFINMASLYYINAMEDSSPETIIPMSIQEYNNRLKYGFSHVRYLKKEKPGVSV